MPTDQNRSTDRVLIVEDAERSRRGYEALLQKWGLDVLGASSAEAALARFSDYHPSVLIADVELPGMDGLSLLERLGADLASVPAIIITGKASEERAVAALESGALLSSADAPQQAAPPSPHHRPLAHRPQHRP